MSSKTDILDFENFTTPLLKYDISNKTWDYSLASFINHKFNAAHTNRTGFSLRRLHYDLDMAEAFIPGDPLETIVDEQGSSYLVQAYSQSSFHLGEKWRINPGVHFQYFLLSRKAVIEPRLGLNWQISEERGLSFGYGQHSRLEKLNFYLARQETPEGTIQPNRNLDFSKAHHFVLGYDQRLGQHSRLKIEPYLQLLYDIPVVEGTPLFLYQSPGRLVYQ